MKNFIYTLIFFGLITASSYAQSNVSFGSNSLNILGSENVAIGIQSLTSSISSGNVAVGFQTLYKTTGSNNTALGNKSLTNNTTGEYNMALGYSALNGNTTGYKNCAFGAYSMSNNSTGFYNTAVGYEALQGNTTGSENIAIGHQALCQNAGNFSNAIGNHALFSSTGSNNNAFGFYALNEMTTGYDNIAIGYKAGTYITTGFRNIIFGSNTSFAILSSYNIAIGYKVGCTGDNNIIIGKRISIADGVSNAMNIGNVLYGKDFKSSESVSAGPANGKIGINVVNPSTTLEVGAANGEGIRIGKIGDIGNAAVSVGALSAQYNIDFTGYRDVALDQIGARISALRINCHIANSALVQKTGLAFSTNASGINTGTTDLVERMRITPEGFIGIGTTSPDALLTVNGTIHSKEVNVALTGPLADYVFDTNYKLMPLHEVEQFVNVNSHLPEMPSADEVSKNGLNMGEMQNKLLQKVEELTLYMIDQQKTINQQSAKIEELEKKLK